MPVAPRPVQKHRGVCKYHKTVTAWNIEAQPGSIWVCVFLCHSHPWPVSAAPGTLYSGPWPVSQAQIEGERTWEGSGKEQVMGVYMWHGWSRKHPRKMAAYSKGIYDIVRGSLPCSPSGFILKELRSEIQESGIKIPALTKWRASGFLSQEDLIGPCEIDPVSQTWSPDLLSPTHGVTWSMEFYFTLLFNFPADSSFTRSSFIMSEWRKSNWL